MKLISFHFSLLQQTWFSFLKTPRFKDSPFPVLKRALFCCMYFATVSSNPRREINLFCSQVDDMSTQLTQQKFQFFYFIFKTLTST